MALPKQLDSVGEFVLPVQRYRLVIIVAIGALATGLAFRSSPLYSDEVA
jgi:hypothetical protein